MNRIYISERGDDKNDGRSRELIPMSVRMRDGVRSRK